MTVKELIEKLQQQNPDAEVVTMTVVNGYDWEYTSDPQVSTHKNMFGEKVFIK